eukprot:11250600-Alexandrium_andersonii.AAC.1
MSASLVGSEMCIRDRLMSAPAKKGGVQGPSTPSRPLEPSRTAAGAPRGCLLYTSDAADDM